MMMHHNTKFGNRVFGSLEDIIWINWPFWPFFVTLTLNAVIHFSPQDALAYNDLTSDQVWLPKNQQFRRYSSQSNILIIWALAVTLTLKTTNNFCFVWHSGSLCSITIPSLVTKCFVVQKISPGQIFTDIFNLRCDLDLKRSNPICPQDTLAYNVVLSNWVWLQPAQQFGRHSRNSHILII